MAAVTVETIEITHLVRQIGEVNAEPVFGDEVLGIVGKAENAEMLGGIGRFRIKGVQVFRIGGAVTEIVDVGQCAELQAEVCIVGHAGEHSESPALADVPVGVLGGLGGGLYSSLGLFL